MHLSRDFRYALRQLRKNPGFTSIAIVALALGIGLSTVIFSIFYNGVLYPFPYRDANRLTVIQLHNTSRATEGYRTMYRLHDIAAFREQSHSFEDVVAYTGWDVSYRHQNTTEDVHGCVLTPNAMQFWGVAPLFGRGLTDQDAQPGSSPAVLLSYAYWKSHFNSDRGVLGKTMMLGSGARTVVGVMPKRFLLYGADVYIVIPWNRPEPDLAQAIEESEPSYFFANGILKKDVSRESAGADLQVVAQGLAATERQDFPEHFQMLVRPFNDAIVGDFKQTVSLLIAAVALLLFISSSNVASLLLTHHSGRAREIALRSALGASRRRLIAQLFVESLVLGIAGCFAGTLLSLLGLQLVRHTPGLQVPGEADLSLNWPVLLFALGVSLITTLLFGLSPAWMAVRRDLRSNLQTSGVNVGAARGGTRVRAGLVVGQVAISMLLLFSAGLMWRSFYAMLHFDPGIRTQGVLTADLRVPGPGYETVEGKRAFFENVLPRILTVPGISAAAVSIGVPMEGVPGSRDITIPGKPHDTLWPTAFDGVSENYFSALGLQLLRGRLLTPEDVASGRKVAVVNHEMVKAYFGEDDPIGRQVKFNEFDQIPQLPHNAYFEIVGVVSDYRNLGFDEAVRPEAYLPYTFTGFGTRSLLVRTSVDPHSVVNNIRQAVTAMDSEAMLLRPQSLDDFLDSHVYMKPKFRVVSFGACAGIGLGLALIGLFGVIAYSVTLQTHDFGVRIALGAQSSNILSLVLRHGLWLVGIGIGTGLALSLVSVRIVRSELWGVSAFDPRTLVVAPLALLATAMLACYIPARRAVKVDPMVALRHD